MRTKSTWLIALAFFAFMALVIWSSFSGGEAHCQVCMVFAGQRNCASAVGASEAEAERAARTTACATISDGVTSSIQCEHTQPATRTCSAR